ncbi:hydrolase, carbon-nitrogen family protein [Dactylonectria estremocensis]|uniref:Hydrolase, carbon-nitrogen family protein n=1 Tax=Dactylonectria estremocensis TaxID=1079267 RepID=A0A9P9F512_9HYPO|nr:hydrolase, carbon-nitrogen family protein [Dactylonectria estremocensis]
MRIGCLQFAPAVGDVDNNLNRADAVLNRAEPEGLDLLVLPELAFTGYNFKSLGEISPFLEPSGSGISSLWARTQALKYDCTVIVGYPEKVDLSDQWPANPEYYNAAIVVSYDGDTVANYRKTHLYYTDETWALENPRGFFGKPLPGLGQVSIGICMDLNPYKFQTSWDTFEFANHVLDSRTRLVVVSMAWITQEDPRTFSQEPQEADMDTLTYWISRLEPIIRAEWDEEVIVVFANRTGSENEATYAGTSAVVGIKGGEVRVYGILGRGDKDLLVVDTEAPPFAKLVYRPEAETLEVADGISASASRRMSLPRGTNSPDKDTRTSNIPLRDGPESRRVGASPLREQMGKASYHRDDLSVRIFQQHLTEGQAVDTPSAPSPTPQNLRPQIHGQHVESITHEYLESQSFAPYRGTNSYNNDYNHPEIDVGFTARQLGLHPDMSPSNSSELYISEMPGLTYKNYGLDHGHGPPPPEDFEGPWMMGREDVDEIISEFGSVSRENWNCRQSLRSDISVWNNQVGKPRVMAALPTPPQEPPSQNPVQTREKASHSTYSERSRSCRPDTAKSRHGSRSRGERTTSAKPSGSESKLFNPFEDAIQKAESSREPRPPSKTRKGASVRKTTSRDRRAANATQPLIKTGPAYSSHERALSSGNSIPIAMDPSVWRDMVPAAPTLRPERPSSNQARSDPPILRPASRSRIAKRSPSNQRLDHEKELSPNPGASGDYFESGRRSNHDSRTTSRGRTRSSKPNEDGRVQATPAREPRTNSRRSRKPSQADIDLSQFRLIEDYPSPNCPVHGSRSRSRARHGHSSSRHRTPVTENLQAPSRQRAGSRPTAHNTPVSAVARLHYGEQVASRSTSDLSRLGQPTELAAPRGKPVGIDSVDMTASNPSSGQEPKTPIPMMLVSEREGPPRMSNQPLLPPLKCVERRAYPTIARPRSAVW